MKSEAISMLNLNEAETIHYVGFPVQNRYFNAEARVLEFYEDLKKDISRHRGTDGRIDCTAATCWC